MKFYIQDRGDSLSRGLGLVLKEKLEAASWIFETENPDIVVFIGGDGTMLEAFHKYSKHLDSTSFVGIHTGHLGFYADWKMEDLDTLIEHLINNDLTTIRYPLLEMQVNGEKYLALNDIGIKSMTKTFVANVYVNGELFEQFRGDGLLLSTPSGSTAYSKSLKGAVVHPFLECIQLSEMASINNRAYRTLDSSMILPKHHTVKIECQIPTSELKIVCDHLELKLEEQEKPTFEFYVSPQKISFIRYKEFPFWSRVKKSFIE